MHHLHMMKMSKFGFDLHWWETHGDFAVNGDEADGYFTWLPDEYCIKMSAPPPIKLDAIINDVRVPSPSTRSTIRFFVEVAFFTLPDPCRSASLVWSRNPEPQPRLRYNTYEVQSTSSMAWWGIYMPYDASMLTFWIHMHRDRADGFLLIAPSPWRDGLPCDELGIVEHVGQTVRVKDIDVAYARLRNSENVVCWDDRGRTSQIVASHAQFDRRSDLRCNRWNFRKGDFATVVAFFRPPRNDNPSKMHTNFFAFVHNDTNATSDDTMLTGDVFSKCQSPAFFIATDSEHKLHDCARLRAPKFDLR